VTIEFREEYRITRKGVTEGTRKLHNEELHNICFFPDIIKVVKSRSLRWSEHVTRIEDMGRYYYQWILNKSDVNVWTGFTWFSYNSMASCLEHGNDHLCSQKGCQFINQLSAYQLLNKDYAVVLGGLVVAFLPLDPKFTGSNLAEDDGFF
jgi:hypothetical protein